MNTTMKRILQTTWLRMLLLGLCGALAFAACDTEIDGDDAEQLSESPLTEAPPTSEFPPVGGSSGATTSYPLDVPALALAANTTSTCLALHTGALRCFGNSGNGALGLDSATSSAVADADGKVGDLPATDLGSTAGIAALEGGDTYNCALFETGQLKCWGQNSAGQLGLGDTEARGDDAGEMGSSLPFVNVGTGIRVRQVALGWFFSCAVLEDHSLKCWGANDAGYLGLGDTEARGDEASEMGDNLPFVDLGGGLAVSQVDTGFSHSCALLENGRVKCWGAISAGALGAQPASGNFGAQESDMGDALPYVDLGSGPDSSTAVLASQISAGQFISCAITTSGELKCWGRNNYGQLGLGDTENRGDEAGEMGDSLPAVNLGTGVQVQSVSTHINHVCALLDGGQVKCWGQNTGGYLGLEELGQAGTANANYGDQAGELGTSLPAVNLGDSVSAEQVIASGSHNCAITRLVQVKCWGANVAGQLGSEPASFPNFTVGDEAGEMGDALPYVEPQPDAQPQS